MHYTLTNFNAPVAVRKRFDAICRASGRTRTSILIELMSGYVLQEGQRLAEREKEFRSIDALIPESMGLRGSTNQIDAYHQTIHSPRQNWGDSEFDIPDPIYSDGRDIW